MPSDESATRAIEAIDEAYANVSPSGIGSGTLLTVVARSWPAARAHIRTLEEQVARLSQERDWNKSAMEASQRALASAAAEGERLRAEIEFMRLERDTFEFFATTEGGLASYRAQNVVPEGKSVLQWLADRAAALASSGQDAR